MLAFLFIHALSKSPRVPSLTDHLQSIQGEHWEIIAKADKGANQALDQTLYGLLVDLVMRGEY